VFQQLTDLLMQWVKTGIKSVAGSVFVRKWYLLTMCIAKFLEIAAVCLYRKRRFELSGDAEYLLTYVKT